MAFNYDAFTGVRPVENKFGPVDQALIQAFLKSCQHRSNPSFSRSLRSWINGRLKQKYQVDPEDAEAKEPSEDFRNALEEAFNERFNKQGSRKAEQKAVVKKRR